jgi:hypothetical protein
LLQEGCATCSPNECRGQGSELMAGGVLVWAGGCGKPGAGPAVNRGAGAASVQATVHLPDSQVPGAGAMGKTTWLCPACSKDSTPPVIV